MKNEEKKTDRWEAMIRKKKKKKGAREQKKEEGVRKRAGNEHNSVEIFHCEVYSKNTVELA